MKSYTLRYSLYVRILFLFYRIQYKQLAITQQYNNTICITYFHQRSEIQMAFIYRVAGQSPTNPAIVQLASPRGRHLSEPKEKEFLPEICEKIGYQKVKPVLMKIKRGDKPNAVLSRKKVQQDNTEVNPQFAGNCNHQMKNPERRSNNKQQQRKRKIHTFQNQGVNGNGITMGCFPKKTKIASSHPQLQTMVRKLSLPKHLIKKPAIQHMHMFGSARANANNHNHTRAHNNTVTCIHKDMQETSYLGSGTPRTSRNDARLGFISCGVADLRGLWKRQKKDQESKFSNNAIQPWGEEDVTISIRKKSNKMKQFAYKKELQWSTVFQMAD